MYAKRVHADYVLKINEHQLKNEGWGDLWPLILWIWAFWSDAKIACFFCTSLEAQKNRKVGPRCGKEAPWGHRGCTKDPIFRDFGPWAPTRAKPVKSSKVGKLASWNRKVGKLEREQGQFRGSNTPKGQRPGEFDRLLVWLVCNRLQPFTVVYNVLRI